MQEKNRDFSIIKKRIIQYLDLKDISKYEFYQKTNIPNGILSQKGGISEENILKFLSYFKDVNPTWLLTGEGEMLRMPLSQQHGQPPPKAVQKEEPKPPGCPLCAEKERVIAKQEQIIKDKDKIIALLEGQLSECKAKRGVLSIEPAAKEPAKLK